MTTYRGNTSIGSVVSTDSTPLQNPSIQSTTNSDLIISNVIFEPGDILTMDAQVIPTVNHTGYGAYTGKFTCSPRNGKYLNVWVKNNGSTTVYLTVNRNGSEIVSDIAIAAGTQKTLPFESLIGGVTGDFEVYVYNKTGAYMDLTVSARQF